MRWTWGRWDSGSGRAAVLRQRSVAEGVVVRVSGADPEHAGVGAGVPGARVVAVADGAARVGSQHAVAVLAGQPGALREVFRAGVKVAAAQGLVGMICHAVH